MKEWAGGCLDGWMNVCMFVCLYKACELGKSHMLLAKQILAEECV